MTLLSLGPLSSTSKERGYECRSYLLALMQFAVLSALRYSYCKRCDSELASLQGTYHPQTPGHIQRFLSTLQEQKRCKPTAVQTYWLTPM